MPPSAPAPLQNLSEDVLEIYENLPPLRLSRTYPSRIALLSIWPGTLQIPKENGPNHPIPRLPRRVPCSLGGGEPKPALAPLTPGSPQRWRPAARVASHLMPKRSHDLANQAEQGFMGNGSNKTVLSVGFLFFVQRAAKQCQAIAREQQKHAPQLVGFLLTSLSTL